MTTLNVDVRKVALDSGVRIFTFEFNDKKYLVRNERVEVYGLDGVVVNSNNKKVFFRSFTDDVFYLAKVEAMFMVDVNGIRHRIIIHD